jgi:O-antigen/teichoic acid export membrane protein
MKRPFLANLIEMAQAIGLYAAGALAASVIGFVALPLFTRIFSPADFGVIGLFTAAVGLLTPSLSLGGYVLVIYDRRPLPDRSGVPEAVMVVASLGTAVAFGTVLACWLIGCVDRVPWVLVALALATGWANTWVMLRLSVYQSEQQPKAFFGLSSIPPLAAFALTLALAGWVDGWAPRVWALGSVAGVAALWSARSLQIRYGLSLRSGLTQLRAVARFGAPLVIHTASIWVVGFTDRFIIAEREGLAAAGVYTVAYSLGLGVSAAHDGVSRYFASRLPEWIDTQSGRLRASRFAYRYSGIAILSIPFLVPVALVGLRVLASDAFSDGTELLVWLIPAQTFAGVVRVFSSYLYIEQRTRHRAVLSAVEAVVNLVLTWVLVGSLGVVGAAIATLITYLLSVVATFVLARRGGTLLPISQTKRS